MEKIIGSAEAAITETGIRQLLADPDYEPETAADIENGLMHLELNQQFLRINSQQAEIMQTVVRYLKDRNFIPPESAEKTFTILNKAQKLSKTSAVVLRKIPIEQVSQVAKIEVERRIDQERTDAEQINRFKSLTLLEKAIYNLEILDSWVSEGTWLQAFLERRPLGITLLSFWERVDPPLDPSSLEYSSKGIVVDVIFNEKITPERLERMWDERRHPFVRKLANFNRIKFAQSLSKRIKD